MSNQLLAVFDCDDVLANLREIVLERLSETLNRPVLLSELVNWDMSKTFGAEIDSVAMFKAISLESIPMEPNAPSVTQLMKTLGYRIEIVTARGYHPHAAQRTLNWCKRHNIHIDKVHVVPLYGDKREVLAGMGPIDIYIEDNHDHVEAAHGLDNVRQICLMDRPWNVNCNFGTRVHELLDIPKFLTYRD